MRMLHRLAHGNHEPKLLLQRQLPTTAKLCDGNSVDKLHGEVRAPRAERGFGPRADRIPGVPYTAVVDFRNIRMIHHGEGLPLRLKSRHDLAAIHSQFDDFESDAPANRFTL